MEIKIVLLHILDILMITIVVYVLLRYLRGSRAMSVLYGLIVVGLVYLLAVFLHLQAFTELFNRVAGVFLIIMVILFQPEIRRGLGQLGVQPLLRGFYKSDEEGLGEIVRAAYALAAKHIGALIVVTRKSGLKAIIEKGTQLDAIVSSDLLKAIFNQYSPIHDGAVIINNNRIVAAGCFLPLADDGPRDLGTRHRAAMGITEESDAIVLVVSEERGRVSLVYDGQIQRDIPPDLMQTRLADLMLVMHDDRI